VPGWIEKVARTGAKIEIGLGLPNCKEQKKKIGMGNAADEEKRSTGRTAALAANPFGSGGNGDYPVPTPVKTVPREASATTRSRRR